MRSVGMLGAVLACCSVVAIGCGSSDGGSTGSTGSSGSTEASGTTAAEPTVKAMWSLGGPEKDGGYNQGAMIPSAQAPEAKFPGKVSVSFTPDSTFDDKATKNLQQSIANGTNFYVDTQGLTSLVSGVCEQNTDVRCFLAGNPGKQAPNTRSWLPADWDLNYLAGMAAGLMTKTGQVGLVASYNVPVTKTVINTYALGCQAVRKDCKVRAVFIDNYFDPTKAAQATQTLIDVGADVIRNYVDDPSFCETAQKRGVLAVGEFADFSAACPKAQIMATVWDLGNYFDDQTGKILDGTWEGGGSDVIAMGADKGTPHLTGWGDFVPADVREKIEATADEIIAGKEVIVGPIYDEKGVLKFKEGEQVSDQFLGYEWKWFVKGVVTAS